MSYEQLPAEVLAELDRRGLNGVPVLVAASTEMSLAGLPGRHWVVATRDSLAGAARQAWVRAAGFAVERLGQP